MGVHISLSHIRYQHQKLMIPVSSVTMMIINMPRDNKVPHDKEVYHVLFIVMR